MPEVVLDLLKETPACSYLSSSLFKLLAWHAEDGSALLLAMVRSPFCRKPFLGRAPAHAMEGEVPAASAAPAEVPQWTLATHLSICVRALCL